jgi:hypothetical protein
VPDVIAGAFEAFAAQLRPKPDEVEGATRLVARMAEGFRSAGSVLRLVETGSYAHGTAVRGESLFDVFVVLSGAKPKSLARSLELLQATLPALPAAIATLQADSVVLEQVGAPGVRLIPAYEATGSSAAVTGADLLWVPDVAHRWVRQRPSAREVLLSRIDDGSLRGLVRLLLAWKHRQSIGVSSYYLETAAIRQALQQPSFSPLWDLCWLWEQLATDALMPLPDLTSPSQTQGVRAAGSLARVIEAQFPLERAASSGRGAVNAYIDGDLEAVTAYLRALFGADFPAL